MLKSAEEWAYYYQSMAEKKARGQRPNCTVVKNARESHNHTPSCYFSGRFVQNLDFRIGPL